jgi:hypothetical protein
MRQNAEQPAPGADIVAVLGAAITRVAARRRRRRILRLVAALVLGGLAALAILID